MSCSSNSFNPFDKPFIIFIDVVVRFTADVSFNRKGALQPIVMGIKLRQGWKTVTVVSGLEAFGVDIDDFAEELRKLCAGSASSESGTSRHPPSSE